MRKYLILKLIYFIEILSKYSYHRVCMLDINKIIVESIAYAYLMI